VRAATLSKKKRKDNMMAANLVEVNFIISYLLSK
jgi:hypothetical protein